MVNREYEIDVLNALVSQNTSNEKRSVSVVLSATTNYYTGVKDREVKRATGIMILQPMAGKL